MKMAEHEELVAEISSVEKMTTTERLKHAKKRRQVQLKKFNQYEKGLDKEMAKKKKSAKKMKRMNNNARRVIFMDNIMLLEAAARNDTEEVRSLLSKDVSPDVTNEDGLTALHQCCIDDLEDMMKILLQFGANVNARDSELWTPLHAAATCGHVHLCKFLIDNGAELLAVNADGNMPYDICEEEETLDFIENEMAKRGVTQELIDETRLSTERQMLNDLQRLANDKGSLEYRGKSGETPLHIAAANGYLEVAEYLLEQRVHVEVEDDDSWQPIHAAACWGHLPLLEVLVQYGADLDARTKNGETPYDICEDPEIRDRILEMRTEIESNRRVRKERLVRRRSTNTRSTSNFHNSTGSLYSSNQSLQSERSGLSTVRRSSVRGKGAIHLKEAKEEATRLREAVSNNDDDDDEAGLVMGVVPAEINDIDIALNGNDDIDEEDEDVEDSSPSRTQPPPPPPTQPLISSTSKSPDKPDSATPSPSSAKTPAEQTSTEPKPVVSQLPQTNKVVTNSPAAKNSIPNPPMMNHRESIEAQKKNGNQQLPQPDVIISNNKRSDAPPPPKTVDNERRVNNTSNNNQQQQQQQQKPSQAKAAQLPTNGQSQDGRHLKSGMSPMGYHSAGTTLADLKKKRAQELHDSMRFRDSSRVSQQIENYNENFDTTGHLQASATSAASPTSPSGQNGAVRRDSDSSHYGLENQPRYKFTASTAEIVGGQDNQNGCCIMM